MKKLVQYVIILNFILIIPIEGQAWGVLGHRIVGEIAENYLSSKAKKRVQQLLGNESVAMSSTWMDFIKSDPSFRYLGNWHYINLAQGLSYPQVEEYLRQDTSTNIYTRIKFASQELGKKETPVELKQMYLRILIHLVGDVHQPLHCGRAEDSGGNHIKVTWFNKPVNLHSLWDSELIDFQQLSYTEYAKAINHPGTSELNSWQEDDPEKWVFESYTLSAQLYEEADAGTRYSYRYNFDHIKALNQQLLKGGVRLAALLNEILSR